MNDLIIGDKKINADLLDWSELAAIGRLFARFGLAAHQPNLVSPEIDALPRNRRDYSALTEKEDYLHLTAAREAMVLYQSGHRTTFDLVHHYYLTSGGGFYGHQDGCHGLPSLEAITGAKHFWQKLSRELIRRDPLQAFYLHQMYQRYVCAYNFHLADPKELARRILRLLPLLKICLFTQHTESDFCDDFGGRILRRAAWEQTRNLPKVKTTKVYQTVVNGDGMGLMAVPKIRNEKTLLRKCEEGYPPEVLLPALYFTKEVLAVYGANPTERSYLLSNYGESFADSEKKMAALVAEAEGIFPLLAKRKGLIKTFLRENNYSVHIRPHFLDKRRSH
jgi:hypothetical protein